MEGMEDFLWLDFPPFLGFFGPKIFGNRYFGGLLIHKIWKKIIPIHVSFQVRAWLLNLSKCDKCGCPSGTFQAGEPILGHPTCLTNFSSTIFNRNWILKIFSCQTVAGLDRISKSYRQITGQRGLLASGCN